MREKEPPQKDSHIHYTRHIKGRFGYLRPLRESVGAAPDRADVGVLEEVVVDLMTEHTNYT